MQNVDRLPDETTSFIGRRSEIGRVRSLLATSRVVTLIGPGGVGKSRLVLAVARDRSRAFPDGVWHIDLDGVESNDYLVSRVSDALGHLERFGNADESGGLPRSLRDKHLLLVLDNCDQTPGPTAELIDRIVTSCPEVRVLATCRAPLRVAGNVTYSVPPLSMPQLSDNPTHRELDTSDAVRFFIDRACAALGHFEATAENRAAVYQTVEDLDRLPLALELAAVRLRSLDIHEIAGQLTGDQAHMSWEFEQPAGRHRTLDASLNWSAALCTEDERKLWGRLSVFRGTFDVDAVQAICSGGMVPDDILDVLQGLVEQSIVVREDHGRVVRFHMLRAVRTFGTEKLLPDGTDLGALNHIHARFYFDLIARADREWNTDRQTYWLQTLPLDHQNIDQALTWAVDSTEFADAAATVVVRLWRYFWWAQGWLAEGVFWVQRSTTRTTNPAIRARLLLIGSLMAWTVGDRRSATSMLEEGDRLGSVSGDELASALAEHVRGDGALYAGHPHQAIEHFRRAGSTYPRTDDALSHRIDTLLMLTLACAAAGDGDGAESAHLQTMELLGPDERFQRSYSLLYLSEARRKNGSYVEAKSLARDALRLKAALADIFGLAWTFDVLARIARDTSQQQNAFAFLAVATTLWGSMSIDTPTLERLQLRGWSPRSRRRDAAGATLDRTTGQLDVADAIALALDDDLNVESRTPRTILTRRETEVAELVAEGLTNKQIATKLVIAQRTADAHVQNVLTKLGFNSRAQISSWVTSPSIPQD